MAEYVALEKSTHKIVWSKPFTSIPTKPTWDQQELLNEEAEQVALERSLSYTWAEAYGLPSEIQSTTKYLSNTGNNYVIPTIPPDLDPNILLPDTTQIQVKVTQNESIVKKRNYTVVEGFRQGVVKNLPDAL